MRIGKQWPDLNGESKHINEFLSNLSSNQKSTLAELLESSYRAGIHDVMAQLNEMHLEGLKIQINGVELPEEPFDTSLHYDYISRPEGDDWPE